MTRADLPLHVEAVGLDAGPGVDTFLMIHGYGASSFTWRHWVPGLAARGRVVLVDLKGHGRAAKPDDGRYAPLDQARLVQALIERDDLRDLTLVGHSLGGGVALLVALALMDHDPARLSRLILVAGAAYEQPMPPFVAFAAYPRLCGLMWRAAGPDLIVRTALRAIVHDASSIAQDQVRGYADPLRSPQAQRALLSSARQIVPPDLERLTARYPEIQVPALLLWGRRDRVVPLAVGERLARALPRARLHVLDDCGHVPPEELPEASLALIEDFLDDPP